jgi:hypothetical protein
VSETTPTTLEHRVAQLLDAVASVDAAQRRRILAAMADLMEATLPAPDPLASRGADPRNAAQSQPVRSVVNRLRAAAR